MKNDLGGSSTTYVSHTSQERAHCGSHEHGKGPSWPRARISSPHWSLTQIHIENSGEDEKIQLSLKAFPRMCWSHPELATIVFSLDPLVAPVRSNPRRKFFSHSCCNLICCLEMQVTVWEMCMLWLSGDKRGLSSQDYACICMAALEQTGQEQELLPEHWFLKYGTWAKLHSMQREGRHGQKKKRETWT